jgi:hypothetical protein
VKHLSKGKWQMLQQLYLSKEDIIKMIIILLLMVMNQSDKEIVNSLIGWEYVTVINQVKRILMIPYLC